METNLSVLFRSAAGEEHFLFQVLNIGSQDTDELKFVFTDPNSGTGGLYQATRDRYGSGDLIRLVPEITYHSDGSLLFKFPSYNARTTTEYRNPQQKDFRRTPLHSIDLWEGFLLYRVHSYEFCKKRKSSNPYLIRIDSEWFNGTPFEVRLFLGGKTCPTPIASDDSR